MSDRLNDPAISEADNPVIDDPAAIGFMVFLRMLGLVVIAVGILLWSQVLGLEGPDLQDLFENDEFQAILIAVLAIVTPVLGVGLWLGMTWALILWGLLGGGLLVLDYMVGKISVQMYVFACVLIVLLAFYGLALFVRFMMRRKKATR